MNRSNSAGRGWLKRTSTWFIAWVLRHCQQSYAIWSLSALSLLDGVLPIMPAEFLALVLMILQPRRLVLIALAFAIAAAASAGLLASVVLSFSQASALPMWLESERQTSGWSQAVALLKDWGAPALVAAAIFPDSPRASVVVATLVGLAPMAIVSFVLLGKLMLYGVLALAVHFLPTRWRGLRHSPVMGTTKWFRRAINRFAALRRWVQKLAAHTMKHDSTL